MPVGILQTLGATRPLVAALVILEGTVLALVGGALGLGVVYLVLTLRPTTLGIEGFGIDLLPEPSLVVLGLAVSLVVGLLASLGPAVEVIRRPLAVAVKPA